MVGGLSYTIPYIIGNRIYDVDHKLADTVLHGIYGMDHKFANAVLHRIYGMDHKFLESLR